MRPLLVLLTVLGPLAAPAQADRLANFSATPVGDTAGVTLVHGKQTWSMKIDGKVVATTEPSQHGDYYVFVSPGHEQIVWILNGDVNGMPAEADTAVQFYSAKGKGPTVRFGELFKAKELEQVAISTSGWHWVTGEPVVVKGVITLPAAHAPVVIDAVAKTATRSRSIR